MADINIKKKDNKPVWPWVIGLLSVIALSIWLFSGNNDSQDRVATTITGTGEVATATQADREIPESSRINGQGAGTGEDVGTGAGISVNENATAADPVQDYINYINDNEATEELSITPEYTSEGLRKLGEALNEVVDRYKTNANANQLRNKFNQKSIKLQTDPQATTNANILNEAFNSAADVILIVQQEHYPKLADQAIDLKATASRMNPREPTTRQAPEIKAFFRKSSTVLDEMYNQPVGEDN